MEAWTNRIESAEWRDGFPDYRVAQLACLELTNFLE